MAKQITTITLLIASIFVLGSMSFPCDCGETYEEIFHLIDDDKNEMIVCGLIKEKLTEQAHLATAISVIDCTNEKKIVDYSYDEIFPYSVIGFDDSIVLQSHHFVPINDNWEMTSIPFKEWTLKFEKSEVKMSNERFIFKYPSPSLTDVQKDSIRTICKSLETFDGNKRYYPLEYETLYILFVGAIMDESNSRDIFESLEDRFLFDGATAETLREISYKTIMTEINNKR